MLGDASVHFFHTSGWTILKYRSKQNWKKLYHAVQELLVFSPKKLKIMLGQAVSPFSCQWLYNVNIHKYTKFEPNIPCNLRVMSIFTKIAQPAKMKLGEDLLPFFKPVAGQC